jgi:hypothetical protein
VWFSGLEHSERQILRLKSQRLLSLEHEGEGKEMEVNANASKRT